MAKIFKEGDRVRRTSALQGTGQVPAGSVGRVVDCSCEGDYVCVDFPGNDRRHVGPGRSSLTLAPAEPAADAPAVGAPGDAFRAAVREELDLATRQMDERNQREPVYSNNQASFPQQDRSQMMGLGGWEPEDVTKLKAENARIAETLRQQNKQIGELEAALKEATGSKLRVGDLQGTVAALRGDVARLEGDVAYWQREAVRLGGKARMR